MTVDEGSEATVDDAADGSDDEAESRTQRVVEFSESVMRGIEIVAAYVLVVLFAVGVFDLSLQIGQQAFTPNIFDPEVVVGFIDTALLLFIIVEVYQTVIAYTRRDETRSIVRLVLYTGIIAIVRKIIVYRTDTFATKTDALLTAGAYALILLSLGALLYVEREAVSGS
jgi:uncharacterized membrane protein (DUF373 family)